MKSNPLIPLGTKIKVDKSKIKSLISQKFLENMPKILIGEVIDYKMTDGMGIGYVLMTEENIKIWVFSNELNDHTIAEYKLSITNNSTIIKSHELNFGNLNTIYHINGNRNIKTTINPINLFSWLLFTLKDIF